MVQEIKHCYYVKNIQQNLISASSLLRENHSILFGNNKVFISKNNSLICSDFFLKPKFPMLCNTETKNEEPNSKRKKSSINDDTYLWHLRLGRINLNRIQRLVKDGSASSLEVQPLPICESCLKKKNDQVAFY